MDKLELFAALRLEEVAVLSVRLRKSSDKSFSVIIGSLRRVLRNEHDWHGFCTAVYVIEQRCAGLSPAKVKEFLDKPTFLILLPCSSINEKYKIDGFPEE